MKHQLYFTYQMDSVASSFDIGEIYIYIYTHILPIGNDSLAIDQA